MKYNAIFSFFDKKSQVFILKSNLKIFAINFILKIKILILNIFYFAHNNIMYFNYHAKVKSLIKSGELVRFEFVENYNGIKPAMVLYFKNHQPIPIKEYHFEEYLTLIKDYSDIK